ncbi:signal peptidase II [Lacibacterium aquatile]|uniref:Lipoprotein signal peptidase n=1 Tax=Lacibacterium aquatile TaxID=1168082 RepID=A0ABW5DU63_9PROT
MVRRPLAHGLGWAVLIILLDQVSKYYMMGRLGVFQPSDPFAQEYVLPFLNWSVVWNRGVSFGMLAADGWTGAYLLSAMSVAVSIALVFWLRKAERTIVVAGIAMVIGGAIGNIFDRMRFGAVFDFIDFHFAGWHPFVFNVADAGISLGVIALLIDGLFPKKSDS